MTSATLDASYPIVLKACIDTAQARLSDRRTREWAYRRLPGVMVRSSRLIVFPAPWADIEEFLDESRERYRPARLRIRGEEGSACEARIEASRRAVVVGHARGEGVISWDRVVFPHECASVFDRLNALEDEDPRLLDKLRRVTWDQAVEKARGWHERLAKLRSTGIAGDDGTANRIDVRAPELPGWYWCQLTTKGALDREGMAMGHCVGSKAYEHHAWPAGVQGPSQGIWSLRDESGRSHVTAEVYNLGIAQALGPTNARPARQTAPAFGCLVGWFARPGQTFRLPMWLVRDEDGSTKHRYAQKTLTETLIEFGDFFRTQAFEFGRAIMLGQLHGDIFYDPDPFQQFREQQEENERPHERGARATRATGYNRNARRGGQRQYVGEPAYRRLERRFAGRPS